MRKLLYATLVVFSLFNTTGYGVENNSAVTKNVSINVDAKNVMAQVKNLVILRSFEDSFWGTDVNSRNCYLEAYNIETGELVWRHKDSGMIVSFIIVNDEKIIYRNYYHITALNVKNGAIIWSKKTKGEFSTIIGE